MPFFSADELDKLRARALSKPTLELHGATVLRLLDQIRVLQDQVEASEKPVAPVAPVASVTTLRPVRPSRDVVEATVVEGQAVIGADIGPHRCVRCGGYLVAGDVVEVGSGQPLWLHVACPDGRRARDG